MSFISDFIYYIWTVFVNFQSNQTPIILKVQSVFVTVVVKLIQEFKCLNRKICFKVNWVHYSFYFCLFLSLLLCAHIAAKTPVHLWCMERQTYRSIMTNKSKKKREQLMGFLKTWVSRLCSHDKTSLCNSIITVLVFFAALMEQMLPLFLIFS